MPDYFCLDLANIKWEQQQSSIYLGKIASAFSSTLFTMQPSLKILLLLSDFFVFSASFKSSKIFQKDAFLWKGTVRERPKSKALPPICKQLDVSAPRWIKLRDKVCENMSASKNVQAQSH